MRSNSLTTGLCACVGLQLALHSIPVGEGSPAVVHIPVAAGDTPVVDTLEAVSAALRIRILAAHADHEVCHALLLVAVQVVVLLLVVRMAVPGCSYVSPSFVSTWLSKIATRATKSIPTRLHKHITVQQEQVLQRYLPTRCARLHTKEEAMLIQRTHQEQSHLEIAKAHFILLSMSITGCTSCKAKATTMSTSPMAPNVR
jgi:hypothetical protein